VNRAAAIGLAARRIVPPRRRATLIAEMPRRLLALFVSFALLLPAGTLGSVLYVCRMTGETGPSCCCMAKRSVAKAKAVKLAKRSPSIRRSGCCDPKVTAAAERPASTIAPDFQVPPPSLVGRLPVELSVAFAPHESLVMAERARGPPPLGDPLYLQNCALLS
jgi:hypothetical protein